MSDLVAIVGDRGRLRDESPSVSALRFTMRRVRPPPRRPPGPAALDLPAQAPAAQGRAQAHDTASRAQSNQQRNELILMAVGALVVLGLVVGAVIYWRRTRTHSRL